VLQTQKAAPWHLPGRDFVHDSAPSSEPVNEDGDKLPLSGVPGIGLAPKRGHPLGHLCRIEFQPLLDVRERDTDVAQRRDQPCLFELAAFVVAVAGQLVDASGRQQTKPVVEAQRLG
jgi:hypothetical protein